jgi:hypothetical protein
MSDHQNYGADLDPEDDCVDASGHRWVVQSTDEITGEPHCYCERCGMDGDA